MSKFVLTGLLVTALTGVMSSDAMAQRDAGAKARGEFGTGFWNQNSNSSRAYSGPVYGRSYNGPSYSQPLYQAGPTVATVQPAPAVQTNRSFSYEPVTVAAGDNVTISVSEANLMLGPNLVGKLKAGQTFKVVQVIDGWLGAVVDIDGQTVRGWVWHRNVQPEGATADPSASTTQPSVERRSFSYEPAEPQLVQPYRATNSGNRMRNSVERRLRPGRGLWE